MDSTHKNDNKINQLTGVLEDYFFKGKSNKFFKNIHKKSEAEIENEARDFKLHFTHRIEGIINEIKKLDLKDEVVDQKVNEHIKELLNNAETILKKQE
ncbi:MAG: hypothetical protein ACQESC_01745 [Nanobdellota archaeon]